MPQGNRRGQRAARQRANAMATFNRLRLRDIVIAWLTRLGLYPIDPLNRDPRFLGIAGAMRRPHLQTRYDLDSDDDDFIVYR